MINKIKDKKFFISFLMLVPAIILFSVFLIGPLIQAFKLSFHDWNGVASSSYIFTGLENYKKVLASSTFWLALRNSLLFIIGGFVVLMPLSFFLATIITSKIRGLKFLKTTYFLPVMLPITAVGLMWMYILQPDWGLLNSILRGIGLEKIAINWLGVKDINVITVVLVNEWIYAGLNMLIFAAGLVAIPQDMYEAAEIDGASKTQQLRYITLPMMKNTFKVFSVLCVTGSLKTFDLMFSMTGGGPNRSSEVPATLLYNTAFSSKKFGEGNTIGVLILLIGLIFSLILNKALKGEEK